MLVKRCSPLIVTIAVIAVTGCGSRFPDEPTVDESTVMAMRGMLEEGATAGSTESTPVELAQPIGWGTLKGVITVDGQPPAQPPLVQAVTHQDARVCAPGGNAPLAEAVSVGPNGGLRGVAIYLDTPLPPDNPQWLHESYESLRGGEVEFDQKNCIFRSHVAAMWTAQKLKVLNSDPIGHNTKIDPRGNARPFNQTIGANGSTIYEPGGEERAPAPVSCSIHPWMNAYLLPRNNPYFAVTDEKGAFEISNIPAGVELEFRVWQPALEFVDGVATSNGDAISKGRVKLTLADGETREFNVSLDAAVFQ
jgi:hypothetical protein